MATNCSMATAGESRKHSTYKSSVFCFLPPLPYYSSKGRWGDLPPPLNHPTFPYYQHSIAQPSLTTTTQFSHLPLPPPLNHPTFPYHQHSITPPSLITNTQSPHLILCRAIQTPRWHYFILNFTVFNTAPGIEPFLITGRYGSSPGAVSESVKSAVVRRFLYEKSKSLYSTCNPFQFHGSPSAPIISLPLHRTRSVPPPSFLIIIRSSQYRNLRFRSYKPHHATAPVCSTVRRCYCFNLFIQHVVTS